MLLLLLDFKSGHQVLDKQKLQDGPVTKVSFLIPRGLGNVHALMAASDPMGKGRDTSLVQLVRHGLAEPECSEHCVLPETECNREALPAHPT